MEAALLQALQETRVRSTVDACLREMVTDVELANQLHERLAAAREIDHLKAQLVQHEWMLEETVAAHRQQCAAGTDMADNLVRELWSLSHQMGELQEIKQQHQQLLVQYDEAIAKLMQMEDALEEAKRNRGASGSRSNESEQDDGKVALATSKSEDTVDTFVSKGQDAAAITSLLMEEEPVAPPAAAVLSSDEGDAKHTANNTAEPGSPESQEEQQQQEPAAVVSLEPDTESVTPTLEAFDTKILMHIFAYLDALDILNTAQLNICMYSRVDSLFGLGNGGETDGGDNSTIASAETTPSTTPAASASARSGPAQTAPRATASVASTTSGTATATPRPVARATQPQQPAAAAAASASASTQHTRSASNEGIRSIFNLLQPRKQQQQQPAVRTTTATPIRKGSSFSTEPAPMNAAMANSMAAKLTDAELNAIIIMTERLRQKEQLAEKLSEERNALAAKLDGTESVKQFLVAKVRDMEQAMMAAEDSETKVAQQVASDQEVIAFLDGRIQELERQTVELKKETQKAAEELARVKEQAEQKGMVMGDMLQFEREKSAENEREWKATRKVLIKEVKSCRAQIVALQAERDGYREQNDMLRKVVLASPSSRTSLGREHVLTG